MTIAKVVKQKSNGVNFIILQQTVATVNNGIVYADFCLSPKSSISLLSCKFCYKIQGSQFRAYADDNITSINVDSYTLHSTIV